MTRAELDVLWAGAREPDGLGALQTEERLSVERAGSLLAAMVRLGAGPARVVLLAADEAQRGGRDTLAALRSAGAGAVVLVYPPSLAHRAPRATRDGADAALVLPTHPGELEATVGGLIRARAAQASRTMGVEAAVAAIDSSPTEAAPPAPPAPPAPSPGRGALESLVGDVALVHRAVSDLERLMEQLVASFRRRSRASRISLLLVDRGRDELIMQRAAGLADREAWTPIPLGVGMAGRVARTGRPLLVRDAAMLRAAAGDLAGDDPGRGRGYNTDSCLVLPLVATEGVVGVVCLADKEDGSAFDEADLRAMSFLAEQAGQALENSLKLRHMRDLAVVDELTGLYNRRYFQGALAREVQRARRYDRSLTVAIMDLDRFKQFNDLCGHPAGDRALALVGEILRTALREVDIVARHGGEEFAVILPETSANEANGTRNPFPFLERLRRQIEEAVIEGEEKLPSGQLTISIGVACFPDDASNAEDLFQKADDALYVSKERGRNCVSYRGRTVEV